MPAGLRANGRLWYLSAQKCVLHIFEMLTSMQSTAAQTSAGAGGRRGCVREFLGFICVFGVVITDASSAATAMVLRGNADASLLRRSAAA